MIKKEDEILDSFFTLLHKVRDVLLVNRPKLLEFVKNDHFKVIRDPFGKYFQTILFIGAHEKYRQEEKRLTMKSFASRFKLKANTATGIIDQLVDRNLVSRENNPKDRRKVELILTEEGKEFYQKADDIQKDEIRSVFDALTTEDMVNLSGILKKINKALVIKDRTATE